VFESREGCPRVNKGILCVDTSLTMELIDVGTIESDSVEPSRCEGRKVKGRESEKRCSYLGSSRVIAKSDGGGEVEG
jgi:hypothetical protein